MLLFPSASILLSLCCLKWPYICVTYCAVSEELTEQPSQKLASVNAVLEEVKDVKGKGNDQDASVVEISSDRGKSLLENGATVVDRSTIGLGEGSPKVCIFLCKYNYRIEWFLF